MPFCGGTTAYTLSILEAVCSTFRHHLRITADDRQLEDTFMMLAVCNGQQYGGGYCAAPHASMTDGLLDVVLLRPVPREEAVPFLPEEFFVDFLPERDCAMLQCFPLLFL